MESSRPCRIHLLNSPPQCNRADKNEKKYDCNRKWINGNKKNDAMMNTATTNNNNK